MATKNLIDTLLSDVEETFGKSITITSKVRTPYLQAKAMYPHFQTDSATLKSYASHKKDMLDDIRNAYKDGTAKNKLKEAVLVDMTAVIGNQVKENKFISNHLNDSARDIRTNDLTAAEIKSLLIILKNKADLIVLDETSTSQPHIHVHLK
ncbi:hypothetical protein L0663_04895 [Dyadobacter sp. CY107]|uniref:hypothetical protein n=1 Tax=Dyadobacter fanqingshengii TaxID=2906443 RepID=UPI001F320BAE|nr:hypothetical protein [Dyadobacter fanqingshengii]MCF2502703.1 hypothetical protein [Dyadobacter fanqingshengii]